MATTDAALVSSSDASNRGWSLDSADVTVRVKPRRPYTPYNLFYLLERELVVQGNEPSAAREKAREKAIMSTMVKRPEDDIPIPSRYKNVALLPMWYEPNMKEKRKHRKTHGKISFKDLTAIISQNWSTIDAETKEYCTRVSDLGRKRYKETITQYNASQKILQLKKERAAMESAKEQKLEKSFVTNKCDSPERAGKSHTNPATPDRTVSGRGAQIVTPPHSGFNNHTPMIAPIHVPSGAPAPFYNYGPPPPMPSSMSHSQTNPHSRPGPSHYHPHSTPGLCHSHPHSMPRPCHSHPHSTPGQVHSWMPTYGQQYHHHHHHHPYSYHQAPALNRTNVRSVSHLTHHDEYTGGNTSSPPMPNRGLGLNLNTNVNVTKVDASPTRSPSERVNLTHDEAMRISNLMESPGKKSNHKYEVQLSDQLLHELPSFDFADHHSLSTEDGDMSRELSPRDFHGQNENIVDNILDLIRSDLGYGEEELFPDIM